MTIATYSLTLSPLDSTQHIFLPTSFFMWCTHRSRTGEDPPLPLTPRWEAIGSWWWLGAGKESHIFLVTGKVTHASLDSPTFMHIQAAVIEFSGLLKKTKKQKSFCISKWYKEFACHVLSSTMEGEKDDAVGKRAQCSQRTSGAWLCQLPEGAWERYSGLLHPAPPRASKLHTFILWDFHTYIKFILIIQPLLLPTFPRPMPTPTLQLHSLIGFPSF